jgi:hypothetical protein
MGMKLATRSCLGVVLMNELLESPSELGADDPDLSLRLSFHELFFRRSRADWFTCGAGSDVG